jgi:DNA-binding transcriptional LysR family regulator
MNRWDGIDEFMAVCDAGSFSQAARRLNVSTSHVSREVARLEDRLQSRLFYRTTRRVTLTDAGTAFAEQFRRIIEQRDEAFATVAETEGEPRGYIRITCSTAYGEHFIAPLITRFVAEHPKVSIHLDLTNQLIDIIATGFDLAIRTGDLADARLAGTRIGGRRLLCCASPAYLTGSGMPDSISDLGNHACLIGSTESWQFVEGSAPRTIRPRGRLRCNNGFAIARAAIAGLGICQLPEFYVEPHIASGALVRLLPGNEPAEQIIWAAHPIREGSQATLRLLIGFLTDNLGEVTGSAQ